MKLFFKFLPLVRFCFFSGLILASLGGIAGTLLVFHTAKDLPKLPSPLSRMIETPQSRIYAANGQILRILGERKSVPLAMVSPDFINAIIAVEDHRFFEHRGINKLRTLKGLYITLFESGKVQGASTITQQLAKNLFFSFEKTFKRKFKELLVAFQMEASNTKEEILHAYINQIHFGAGAQGIEKAAQVFFGKSALDLTLPEASLLAGLPKSPTNYNPFRYYDRALKRQGIVLQRMVKAGFITEQEADQAGLVPPELHERTQDAGSGSYFVDALTSDLVRRYGEDVVYHGGIKVYATIDPRLQNFARNAVKKGLENLDDMMGILPGAEEKPQGAMVSIDAGSGAVKALVGGRLYARSQFNRAVNSRRQAGSGFKPFLYYAAFTELGYHPASIAVDRPVVIPVEGGAPWTPGNFNNIFSGQMILKKALVNSVNTVAAQMVEQTGAEAVNRIARTCGIKSPLSDVYSVALGTSGVTPFEMAAAYSVFASLGTLHEPYLFRRVEDAFGRVIFEHIIQERKVLEPAVAYQLVDMMRSVIDTGSGRAVRRDGFDLPAAGKTGTTDAYNDAWFTGFTPALSTSVWTGFDKTRKLVDRSGAGITGGRIAAPIWADYMKNALGSEPARDFPIPDSIRFETVDTETGCIHEAGFDDRAAMRVALKSGQHLCDPEGQ